MNRQSGRGKLTEGWHWVHFGDVCEIKMGQSPDGSTYNSEGRGIPLLNGPTEFGPVHPTPVQWTTSPLRFAEQGDILLCVRGATTGRKNLADQRYCIGRGLAAIRGNGKQTLTDFLLYVLDFVTVELLRETAGSTFPNLPGERLASFKIPLPPLPEQKRIAAILNQQLAAVERARAAAEAQLEAAKKLPTAYLRAAFESPEARKWPKKNLGEICRDVSDGTHFTPTYVASGVPFLSVKNVKETGLSFTDCRYITDEQHREFCRRCRPERGDVLYTKVGTTGIAKAIDTEREFSIFVSVALLKLSLTALPEYVERVLNAPISRVQAAQLTQGIANRNLVLQDLKRIEIPLPSLPEQRRVTMFLNERLLEAERLRRGLEECLNAVNKIPSALLRQAFNGEL